MLSAILPQAQQFILRTDWLGVIQGSALVTLSLFLAGGLFRLLFGRGHPLISAVSAVLSMGLVYLAAVLLELFLPQLRQLPALPFLEVTARQVRLLIFTPAEPLLLYPALLRLGILAFLVNLLESALPTGEGFWSWYLWRTVTVLAALSGYALICACLDHYAPEILGSWAEAILWGFWALIALLALVKLLTGLILSAMNPLVGGLYSFFFSRFLGLQMTKSILTAGLCLAVCYALHRSGLTQFAFADFTLAAYGPTCLITMLGLYFFGRFL